MTRSFQDKICIVTGAAKGIGYELCRRIAADGAVVVMADIDQDGVNTSRDAIAAEHTNAKIEAHILNVTDRDSVFALVRSVAEKHGHVDYIFNNAGINTMAEFRDVTMDLWQRIIDVNLWGVIHGSQAAYQTMADQGHGHIVNIASGLGLVPAPRNSPYSTTKFAVFGLSEALRIEGKDLGISVSVVCPGWIATPQVEQGHAVVGEGASAVTIAEAAKTIPLKFMTAEKSARLILKGVLKKKARIVFPAYVRWTWRLYRLCPPLADLWFRHEIRAFRKLRDA